MTEAVSEQLARAFVTACGEELRSPKPGNVHVFAPGHGMEAEHFLASAEAAAAPLAAPRASVGERILGAIEATWARVGMNTNLGIVLLCAPLAHAVLGEKGPDLRGRLRRVLEKLDQNDADLAFRAIMRASPAGLGTAPEHDVRARAKVSLLQAMQAAAQRDRIASQYASGFKDIFETGLVALAESGPECDRELSTLRVYAAFLSAFPDSHVVRKFGEQTGDRVLSEAREFARIAKTERNKDVVFAAALRLDRSLKERGINPGTSADLTVATLFAEYAARILANAGKND